MKIETKANIKQVIEIIDKDTRKKEFLVELDGEWVTIDNNEYQKIIRGEK